MREKGLMGELVAETFGTFVLILLGDGVVANRRRHQRRHPW